MQILGFEDLSKFIEGYGQEDLFVSFVNEVSPFMRLLKELRNTLDHRLHQFVVLTNYEVQSSSEIISPSIELKLKNKASLPKVSLSYFLPIVQSKLIDIVEAMFAYLAEKNKQGHMMSREVREIPEDKRKNKFVRYAFWGAIGDGGYYNQ